MRKAPVETAAEVVALLVAMCNEVVAAAGTSTVAVNRIRRRGCRTSSLNVDRATIRLEVRPCSEVRATIRLVDPWLNRRECRTFRLNADRATIRLADQWFNRRECRTFRLNADRATIHRVDQRWTGDRTTIRHADQWFNRLGTIQATGILGINRGVRETIRATGTLVDRGTILVDRMFR